MKTLLSVDNISGAGYRLCPPPDGYSIEFLAPVEITDRVLQGHVTAALLPIADLPLADTEVGTLGTHGIACTGIVGSVQLFCAKPLSEIALHNLPVYLDTQSRTSRALFMELYRRSFPQLPNLSDDEKSASACLYIGNRALDSKVTTQKWAEVVDLGAWWYRETKKPFVFARWVARQSLAESEYQRLEGWLLECARLADTPAGRQTMIAFHRDQISSEQDPTPYYDRMRYALTEQDLDGLEIFLTSLEKEMAWAQTA